MPELTSVTRRRTTRTARAVLVLATLVATLSLLATWARQQLLNTDRWTQTSTELLQRAEIRAELAAFLTDQLFAEADVQAQIAGRLPEELRPLAPAATAGARRLVQDVADQALQRPAIQAVWEDANRESHRELVRILEGGGDAVTTRDGVVVLRLRGVLTRIARQIGLPDAAIARIPRVAGDIEVLSSRELALAQDVATLLKAAAVALGVLTVALLALAVWLAAGSRRRMLARVGLGLITSGVLALLARGMAGQVVVDTLAPSASIRPAAGAAWDVGTSLLVTLCWQAVVLGLLLVLASALAGASPTAITTRRKLAPRLREQPLELGFVAAICIVALVAWAPIPALRQPVFLLMLAVLLPLAAHAFRGRALADAPLHSSRNPAATDRPPASPTMG